MDVKIFAIKDYKKGWLVDESGTGVKDFASYDKINFYYSYYWRK